MADFPTSADLFRIARDEMLAKNSRITREAIEKEGTDVNAITASIAAVGDECINQTAQAEASLFLDSAKGNKLDRLVFDRCSGMLRKRASPAQGSVEFTTTVPNPVMFGIPVGTKLQTADGRQFITSVSATFPALSSGPITVAVRSILAGANQQAAIGTITSIIDSISGQPTDLVVNNTLATFGADDEELDPSLRDRARQFFVTARRGTIAAIRQGALAVPGVRTATVFEALDALGRPAKFVQLVVADAFTDQLVNVNPTPAAYQAQSAVLTTTIDQALYDVRAAGIFVQIQIAQVVLQGVTLALRFQAGVNVDLVALEARAAVVNSITALSPGETMRISALLDALRTVRGLSITGQEIYSPVGDVVPQTLQVIRSSLSLVAAVSLSPDQALQGSINPDAV